MAACPACAKPSGHVGYSGCRGCQLRELARGPWFWASMRAGRLTPQYLAACKTLGADVQAVHAEVRAVAKALLIGSSGA